MAAREFKRSAASLLAAVSLAATIATFAVGQSQAQTVNPVPPPPGPPAVNPSTPNTVTPPPAPVVPISPTAPSAPLSPSAVPGPEIAVPPASVKPDTTTTRNVEHSHTRIHVRTHERVRSRWSRRHGRYWLGRVVGPSYYPGLGEVYPPYINPCRFRPTWYAYYGVYPSYRCSW